MYKRQAQYGLVYKIKDTSKINRIFQHPSVQSVIPSTVKFLWLVKKIDTQNTLNDDELLELYAIKKSRNGKAPLTGESIIDARQDLDDRSRPAVSMQMDAMGAKAWKRLTGNNIGKRIAIVLDNFVYSAPTVQGEIPNGNSSISGNFTIEEAQDLANSGWNYTSATSYVTMSFWVKSSVAQNFYGHIETADGTSYNFPFETGSLTADTWKKVVIKIPGNSNLTFNNDNGGGMSITFTPFYGTDSVCLLYTSPSPRD